MQYRVIYITTKDEEEAARTRADLVDKTIKRVRELHSYEIPEIISLPIEKGWPDYLNWIKESTEKEITA